MNAALSPELVVTIDEAATNAVEHFRFLADILGELVLGNPTWRNNGVKNARGAPRPLIRKALLGPFSSVHSAWSMSPGGRVFRSKSHMRYEPITIAAFCL